MDREIDQLGEELLPSKRERAPSELENYEQWEFPGWGEEGVFIDANQTDGDLDSSEGIPLRIRGKNMSLNTAPPENGEGEIEHEKPPVHSHKLGEWSATAISGNDITSSCLYTAGICALSAGVYAPIGLLLIVCMLYLFRSIYSEVCMALPLNGGAYNALLNTTSKSTASVAACLTILSYVATGVVSAAEACSYLNNAWSAVNVDVATILLLAFFAILNLMGITESAKVALVIFVVHCATLLVLMVASAVEFGHRGWDLFSDNYHDPEQPAFGHALLFGFSSAALGISGFESSANFIEEQKPGVFPKTLRNMWFATLIFNPVLSFLSTGIISSKLARSNYKVLLAKMGGASVGSWFETWISLDAFLVLSGAVITAYVGVVGLCRRLAGDRCLPAVLLHENKWRRTNHWIIIVFFGICASMYLILAGDVEPLSAVYTLSFLSVMSLFAVGDMLLKYKRSMMLAKDRAIRSSWFSVFAGFVLVIIALIGTVINKPQNVRYFAIYFSCTAFVFAITFMRIQLLKFALYSMTSSLKRWHRLRDCCSAFVTRTIRNINSTSVVFFSRTDKLSILNKAMLYIRDNEHTRWVRMVHVAPSQDEVAPNFVKNVRLIDEMYPKIRVDSVIVIGAFGASAIETVEKTFGVPRNLMFIAAPGDRFRQLTLTMADLGGVRIITH